MHSGIKQILFDGGADIVRFVDISSVPEGQTQGFTKAVLIGLALSKDFIRTIKDSEQGDFSEFSNMEKKADTLADQLAEYIEKNGYRAFSKSDESNLSNGNFYNETKSSKLPHKTVARLAGFGFIGKNNLLITEDYGCAIVLCAVLTDAPLPAENLPVIASKCGMCDVCKNVCPVDAIYGVEWTEGCSRDDIVDVFKCVCSLKCMVNCPYTLKYANEID